MKSYNLLMGTSGTGKGTRVSQLISFLLLHYDGEFIKFEWNGKEKQLGIHIKDLDIFFIGKIVTSNKSGLSSWTSLDYINSTTKKTDLAIKLIKEYTFGHVVGEGEPMLISNKYRPLFMVDMYGIKNMSFHIFSYEDRVDYDNRIIGRSGKKTKGDGGWNRNKSYAKVYQSILKEKEQLGPDYTIEAFEYKYNAPITIFGENFLHKIGLSVLVPKFLEYSLQYDTLREV